MIKYTFFFNGKEYYTNAQITLNELINYFNYESKILIVEYNNFICNKQDWKKTVLKSNDKIEIVTIVGGG